MKGLRAIQNYLERERKLDTEHHKETSALFLPAYGKLNETGHLTPNAVNDIWRMICRKAEVHGKTPHSARHGMGRHLIEKTGNIEAVQRQLGHKNAAYSLQYSRITKEELNEVLDNRG
jgi:integrase